MSRECPVCHHSMTQILRRHVQTWHDRVVFDNVPAEVCSQCRETLCEKPAGVFLGARASGPLRKQARCLQLPGASRADSQKLNDLA
jgi:YgiT-type zinc finger domain-containing protein